MLGIIVNFLPCLDLVKLLYNAYTGFIQNYTYLQQECTKLEKLYLKYNIL